VTNQRVESGIITRQCHKINNVKALKLKFGKDGLESIVWTWHVVVGATQACTSGVPSSQWHIPAGSSSLHNHHIFEGNLLVLERENPFSWLFFKNCFQKHFWKIFTCRNK